MNAAPVSERAFYVYAVLPGGTQLPPGSPAVLPDTAVETVQHGSLAAVVSLVPRGLFAADHAASRASDPDWVAARAEAHHRVVDLAATNGPCLPLGFGTLFTSEATIRLWLAENASRIHGVLGTISNRQEWALTLKEDVAAHATWLEAHDPDIRVLAEASRAASPGTRFLLERRLAKALEDARARHAAALGARLMERLQAEHRMVRQETTRQGSAWSVLADRHSDFTRRTEALSQALLGQTGLDLRVTGPWPPYAFARAAWQGQTHA